MKNVKTLLALLALVPFFGSCSSDDDNDSPKGLVFSKENVEIIIGETANITVKNGDGTYIAISGDEKVATVLVKEKNLEIKGLTAGTSLITVTDGSEKEGKIKVTVIEDPYVEMKADATTRFTWNEISKVNGTDEGIYKLTKTENKVEFTYNMEEPSTREEGEEAEVIKTISLSFNVVEAPEETKIEPILEGFKLVVNETETPVETLKIIKTEKVEENETETIWIVFNTGEKEGICVATYEK